MWNVFWCGIKSTCFGMWLFFFPPLPKKFTFVLIVFVRLFCREIFQTCALAPWLKVGITASGDHGGAKASWDFRRVWGTPQCVLAATEDTKTLSLSSDCWAAQRREHWVENETPAGGTKPDTATAALICNNNVRLFGALEKPQKKKRKKKKGGRRTLATKGWREVGADQPNSVVTERARTKVLGQLPTLFLCKFLDISWRPVACMCTGVKAIWDFHDRFFYSVWTSVFQVQRVVIFFRASLSFY